MVVSFQFLMLLSVTQIWNMKSFVIVIYLTVQFEKFYAAMKDVQSTCTLLINSRHCSGMLFS